MLTEIEARRIDKYTYDLFFGKQWGSWSRVRQGKNGVYRVAGEKVDHQTLKALNNILAPRMPITYGQDIGTMYRNNIAIQ